MTQKNVLQKVSIEFNFCIMCVKWGFDNNKKHTKEGHDNPRLFIASYKRVKCMIMFICSIPRQCILDR